MVAEVLRVNTPPGQESLYGFAAHQKHFLNTVSCRDTMFIHAQTKRDLLGNTPYNLCTIEKLYSISAQVTSLCAAAQTVRDVPQYTYHVKYYSIKSLGLKSLLTNRPHRDHEETILLGT